MKKNIGVLFGGMSSEHEVSCISATTIMNHLDKTCYNVYPIGISKAGEWYHYKGTLEGLKNGKWLQQDKVKAIISPDASDQALIVFEEDTIKKIKLDVVIPALHGLYGEDGTVQGLLDLAKIPYVGCGVLASAISMDKFFTKIVVDRLGIRQAQFVGVYKQDLKEMTEVIERIESKFTYPVFVKPSNAGSSVGVTKAHKKQELIDGLTLAAQHDRKILVEEFIKGREVECAVIGNDDIKSSGVGEILAAAEFYDYDAKYNNAESKTVLSADLPSNIIDEIRESSRRIFRAVDGTGLARVDFFVEENTNEVVFNEINTLPGFTSISMFPMLWQDNGIEIKELVEKLINLALERSHING